MSVPMSFMVFQFEFLRLGIKAVSVWARLIFYSQYVWRRATVDGKCLVQWSKRIMHTRRIHDDTNTYDRQGMYDNFVHYLHSRGRQYYRWRNDRDVLRVLNVSGQSITVKIITVKLQRNRWSVNGHACMATFRTRTRTHTDAVAADCGGLRLPPAGRPATRTPTN